MASKSTKKSKKPVKENDEEGLVLGDNNDSKPKDDIKKMRYLEWLTLHAEHPLKYTYTADGNAYVPEIPPKKDKITKVIKEPGRPAYEIKIPMYVKSVAKVKEKWEERQAKFDSLYTDIEIAKTELRKEIEEFQKSKTASEDKQTGNTENIRRVISAGQKVALLERKLIHNRSSERWIEGLFNPSVNVIDLKNKSESRSVDKMLGFTTVYICKRAVFNETQFLEELTDEQIKQGVGQRGGTLEDSVLQYGIITDDTILGIHWPIEIQVGSIKYFTAYQAILGELAQKKGNSALFESILGTRSNRTLHLLTKELTATDVNEEVIKKVVDTLVKRDDFRELLLSTGIQELVYANEEDPIFGIGLHQDDPKIQNAKHWRGENLWGKALEAARTVLREKAVTQNVDDLGLEEEDPLMAAVISEAQQAEARKGAIIAQRRFGGKKFH